MASFVAEVLTTAGQLESQEVSLKLQHLSKEIMGLKLHLYNITVNKYTDFTPKLQAVELLVNNMDALKAEMDDVDSRIADQIKNQLNVSTREFQSLTSQLEDVRCILLVLEKLVHLQDCLESLESAVRTQDYCKAADAVHVLKSIMSQKAFGYEDEIKIMSEMQTEIQIQIAKLSSELCEKWREMLLWIIPQDKDKKSEKIQKIELRINTKGEHVDLLEKVIIGMHKMNILNGTMKKFSRKLLKNVIEPLVMNSECEVIYNETGQGKILCITVDNRGEQKPTSPKQMFETIEKVLQFLNENLLHVIINDANDENESPVTLMSLLGGVIADKTLETVVKECLIKAIPSSNKELEEFNNVVVIAEDLQRILVKWRFIPSDHTILKDYIENINVLFANKKCQELLEHARKLMTTEVHNSVLVTPDQPLGQLPALIDGHSGVSKKCLKDDLAARYPLDVSMFRLPTCHISSSIQMLMSMAYDTLHEATESSTQCAVQLFFAVRNMFELFFNVFPTYHRQSLETLPQFTALHYNNCMYIAHNLMILGHQFNKKLPQNINATFVDMVPTIRRLGTESFLQQLSKQKAQLSEYLAIANGFLNVSEKDAFLTTERALKQVLHHLHHLKNVWQNVLPFSNYRKAIGSLLNGVIVEITDSIVTLEDISTDDAKQLSGLLNTLAAQAPELLKTDCDGNATIEIQCHVAKWQRFRELDMVLNASMIDIGERWATGKGPLAVVFSPNELKQLIRALFQNTDRRAALISKIK